MKYKGKITGLQERRYDPQKEEKMRGTRGRKGGETSSKVVIEGKRSRDGD